MKPSIQALFDELSRRLDALESQLKKPEVQLGHRAIFSNKRSGEVPQAPTPVAENRFLREDGTWVIIEVTGSGGGDCATGSLGYQRFSYLASGTEGSSFVVSLPTASLREYTVVATLADLTGSFSFRIPSGSRTTTQFTMETAASLQIFDRIDFLIFEDSVISGTNIGVGVGVHASASAGGAMTFRSITGSNGVYAVLSGSTILLTGSVVPGAAGPTGSAGINGTPAMDFGNGADGDVTINGNTTITRDMHYRNLTVNSGANLNTAAYRVYVNALLTWNGSIRDVGLAGSNGTHTGGGNLAAARAAGLFGASLAGGQGGYTVAGGTTSNVGSSYPTTLVPGGGALGAAGAIGGIGGNGTSGTGVYRGGGGGGGGGSVSTVGLAGGVGGIVTILANSSGASLRNRHPAEWGRTPENTTAKTCGSGGAGGGAGGLDPAGGSNRGGGGGGGASGGQIFLAAYTITGTTGTLDAYGGDGGNGGSPTIGNSGGGGGGAGGGGGRAVLVTTSSAATVASVVTVNVSGGLGGTGGNGNGTGAAGGNGGNGATGVAELFTGG